MRKQAPPLEMEEQNVRGMELFRREDTPMWHSQQMNDLNLVIYISSWCRNTGIQRAVVLRFHMPASDGLGGHKGEPWKLGKGTNVQSLAAQRCLKLAAKHSDRATLCPLPCRIRT